MKSRYKVVEKDCLHFISSSIVEMIPLFINEETIGIIINSLNFCCKNKSLKIYAYVIMPNHIHLIVCADDLAPVMQSFKSYTAHELITYLEKTENRCLLNLFRFYKKKHKSKSEYQVWQEGFHPELISSNKMYEQKTNYIHFNPVKKGFVRLSEHWKYSSACNIYLDGQSILPISLIDE